MKFRSKQSGKKLRKLVPIPHNHSTNYATADTSIYREDTRYSANGNSSNHMSDNIRISQLSGHNSRNVYKKNGNKSIELVRFKDRNVLEDITMNTNPSLYSSKHSSAFKNYKLSHPI